MAFRIPGALAFLVVIAAATDVHSTMNAEEASHVQDGARAEEEEEFAALQTDVQQASSVEQAVQHKTEEASAEDVGLSLEAGQDLEEDDEMEKQAVKDEMKTLDQEE